MRTSVWIWVGGVTLAGLLSCGEDKTKAADCPDDSAGDTVSLNLASYLTAPGEVEAMQSVVDGFTATNGDTLVEQVTVSINAPVRGAQYHAGSYAGTDTIDAVEWDLGVQTQPFLGNTADVLLDLGAYPELTDALASVTPLLAGVIKPATVTVGTSVGTTATVTNTKTLGAPLGLIRLNSLVYNLDEAPLSGTYPPQTLQDYYDLCDNYVTNGGKVPLAIPAPVPASQGGNPRSYLVMMLGLLPPDVLFARSSDGPAVRQAVTDVVKLQKYYRNHGCFSFANDPGTDAAWDDAMQKLLLPADEGGAYMTIIPGWGSGYMVASGRTQGVDFGVDFAIAGGPYVMTSEILMANAETEHPEQTVAFVGTALSLESQIGFAKFRGGVPAVTITDADAQITDPDARENYEAYATATAETRAGFQTPWIRDANKPDYLYPQFMGYTAAQYPDNDDTDVNVVVNGYLCSPTLTHPTTAAVVTVTPYPAMAGTPPTAVTAGICP